jgi:outer membrane protein insertion porin family
VRLKGIVLTTLFLATFGVTGFSEALDSLFRIDQIQFIGLLRIPKATALNYLPVKPSDTYQSSYGPSIVRSLYDTGYFKDVNVYRQGNNLVIKVEEWPVIGTVRIEGNKEIKSKSLEPVLKNLGIEVGQTFSPNKLNLIVQGLTQQYENMGYPAVTVTPSVTSLPNNRVAIDVRVVEGGVAKLRSIHFVGNNAFSSARLRGQMSMSSSGIMSWFNNSDHFSEFRLDQDLNAIRDYYLNHGYLKVVVKVQKIDRRPNGVYLTIVVSEGERYRVSGFQVTGKTLGKESDLLKRIDLNVGGYFSKQDVVASESAISDFIANQGYAFPQVHAIPKIDALNQTVSFDFNIMPGARVYVRQISIDGNYRTKDVVIRRELRQLEGSLYSNTAIDRSKQRLMLLGFFEDVKVKNEHVPNHPELVDLKVSVNEIRTGSAQVQAGYDTAYGIVYGASISEKNFLGSGDGVSVGFQNNAVIQNYSIGFSQPYYRPNGMSRAFQLYYTRVSNKPEYNLDSSYKQDGLGLSVNYGLPITENSSINFGFGYENVNINHVILDPTNQYHAVPSVVEYLALPAGKDSRSYNDFTASGGFGYNNLDRAIFPTAGFANGISAVVSVPVLASSAPYYIGSYNMRWYEPLFYGFIFNFQATIQYGSGFGKQSQFPFFKNFYLGGIGSIPGFEPNSLGPWNTQSSTALGGNLATVFNVNFILPEFISPKIRTSVILSAGNVFQTPRNSGDLTDPNIVNLDTISILNLRTSAGVMFQWFSPMGMIDLSFAVPLNKRANDQEKMFDFSFGTSF